MKSLVGLILGLVGSIFNLFLSGVFLVLFVVIYLGKSALIENNLSENLISFASKLGFWFVLLCLWFIVFGLVGVFSSSMMNREGRVRKGGIICLVSGLLTLNLFMVIGGVMGIIVGRMDNVVESDESDESVAVSKPAVLPFQDQNQRGQAYSNDGIPDQIYE